MTEYGKFLATVHGHINGNILLRRSQYRHFESTFKSLEINRNFIFGKIANTRTVLQRATRDHNIVSENATVNESISYLGKQLARVRECKNLDILRGIEGDAAKTYFRAFDSLILNQKDQFFLQIRNRRPSLDNMNALLSFLYTLLTHEVRSSLEAVGLDPASGFLHQPRPGRPSLALDFKTK